MGESERRDWLDWHSAYEDPTSALSRRLSVVRDEFREALDAHRGATRVISICAGQGRDVLPVLAAHPNGRNVDALLVELDPRNTELAQRTVDEYGLKRVRVLQGDAASTDSYVGAAPANIVLACGIFGNVSDEDVRRVIAYLPCLCAANATVLWTRGRQPHRDFAQEIRGLFADGGFEEIAFDAPDDTKYRVGVCRLVAAPRPLKRGVQLFRFNR